MLSPTASSTLQTDGTSLPQAIAHRGYKAAYPENSMAAFVAAVEVGAHAIETDLHISKDGVVVLSHVSLARNPQYMFLIINYARC